METLFKTGDRVEALEGSEAVSDPGTPLTAGQVYTVDHVQERRAEALLFPNRSNQYLEIDGHLYFSDNFKPVETRTELFTIEEPHHLKPGDVVVEAPEGPTIQPSVKIRREVVVEPPKPPTALGSMILARPTDSNPVELFLTDQGWENGFRSPWDLEAITLQGFEVIRDAGAAS